MSKKIITTVNKLPNSQVEITATIPYETIKGYRAKAIKQLQETITIDGFRKGHIPESALIEKIGEHGLLAEMADHALTDSYSEIITESKTQPISRPEISITKLDLESDVTFTITSDVMPSIEITDVKSIAQKNNKETFDTTITDEEFEKSLKEIRQMRAHDKMHTDGIEHTDHNHQNIPDEELPGLDTEFVKTLGDFENVEDFKAKFRENLVREKENQAREKNRLAIIEEILEKGTFDIPTSMINFELDRMVEQFKHDLAMSGMKLEDYLNQIGKKIEDIRTEWNDQAKKRVLTQLILEKIAIDFSITPDKEKVDAQIAQMKEMYKDQAVDEANIIGYVNQMFTNMAVFEWLESQK